MRARLGMRYVLAIATSTMKVEDGLLWELHGKPSLKCMRSARVVPITFQGMGSVRLNSTIFIIGKVRTTDAAIIKLT